MDITNNRHSSWAVEFDKFIATSLSASSTQYPNVLKILTWNVWFSEYKMKERMFALLTEAMLVHEADILCLQEVTNDFHGAMLQSKYISARYICSERDDVIDYDVKIWIKKGSKILNTWVIQVPSVQGRRCLVVDFVLPTDVEQCTLEECTSETPRGLAVRVATVHLESLKHNRTLRAEQLGIILDALTSPSPASITMQQEVGGIFLTGDFNFCSTWTEENDVLEKHPCVRDIWPLLHPDESGFTEDTTVNTMLMSKRRGDDKHVRFDRIVQLFPSVPVEEEEERFRPAPIKEDRAPSTPPGNRGPIITPVVVPLLSETLSPMSIRITGTDAIENDLFPSDHFGLVASFRVNI
jgi:endonuclease/exonuclease/phosphatase family metal-dependent hydrolase